MPEQQKNKRLILASVIIVAVLPLILFLGVWFGDRNYGVTSTLIVILSMLPFFLVFEHRRPQAREILPIAVMAAIAAVGRLAFAFAPQFKPILAIIIITAVSFGAESGFLCGAVAMLVSNFFFGQGPWTPWQMFCCGLIGFVAGWLRQIGLLKGKVGLCIYGVISGYLYGAIVDIWTILGTVEGITWQSVLAIYASGFWFNTILAGSTALFLYLLAKPIIKKLERIKVKYGLLEQ